MRQIGNNNKKNTTMIRRKNNRPFIDPHFPIEFASNYGFYCDIEEGFVFPDMKKIQYGNPSLHPPQPQPQPPPQLSTECHSSHKKQKTNIKHAMHTNLQHIKRGVYSVMICYALCMSIYISMFFPIDMHFDTP